MMSYDQMNRMAAEATERARKAALKPAEANKVVFANAKVPFLGDYVPKGFRRVDCIGPREMGCADGYLFVDASGFGNNREPALTQVEFHEYVRAHPNYFFGVVEAGQFQVVVATYEKLPA